MKKQPNKKKTVNSAKITTSRREYDANCPITVLNNKKDTYTVLN